MAKASNNKKGFGGVKAISLLVVLIVIVVAGLLVYKHDHKTKVSAAYTSGVYKDWKSYSDNYFSFKYPTNWQADKPPSKIANNPTDVTLVGLLSPIPSYMTASPTASGEILNFVFYKSRAVPNECVKTNSICSVKIVTPLTTNNLSNPKLIVFSQKLTCSQGTTCNSSSVSSYELIDSSSEKVGDSIIPQGFSIDGKTYQAVGCSLLTQASPSAGGSDCATISNYPAFEASTDYKNLVNVLDSLTIK